MTGWFGESWGAPVCDPEDHVRTPVGRACLWCGKPIEAGDQGLLTPCVNRAWPVTIEAEHLACLLKRVLPHGHDCPHCRGMERNQHALRCEYRQGGGECNCVDVESL